MRPVDETNLEYAKLVKLLNGSDMSSAYTDLMQKEERVLDTINRVVNYSNEKQVKATEFMNMSLDGVLHAFFWNMRLLFGEILAAKNAQQLLKSLTKEDRAIYIGMLLVFVALFLFFVFVS